MKKLGLLFISILVCQVVLAKAQPVNLCPLDYSFCGYRQSETTIPNAPAVMSVACVEGDNYARLQRAIDYVATLKVDRKTGLRGAIVLGEGVFEISEPLRIAASGVVLRGQGRGKTIIRKTGVDRCSAIYIEGTDDFQVLDTLNIITEKVALAEKSFAVGNGQLKVGDRIMIHRPSTKEWIAMLGCTEFGGGEGWTGWHEGEVDVRWDRTVTAVSGNTITLDVPLSQTLETKWADTKMLRYTWKGRIEDSGVENMSIESSVDKTMPMDEDHCWNGVFIANAENCWVRQVSFRYLSGSAVAVQRTGSQITVEDCLSTDPVSEIGGFRRRTFYTLGQKCLFQRCYSKNGINDFCVGLCTAGPNAFVQCDSEESLGFSGSISSWATGLLFDIVNIDGNDLKLTNLGQDKYGAGWNTANSTLYQCTAAGLYCASPTSEEKNYAIGCWGQFQGNGEWAQSNNHVQPRSLYYSQLEKRLGHSVDAQARLLPRSTTASSSPTAEVAIEMMRVVETTPRLTLPMWIDSIGFTADVNMKGLKPVEKLSLKSDKQTVAVPQYEIKNGKLVRDGLLVVGKKHDTPWWAGRLKDNWLPKASYALTRFVPGREGLGLTDRVDSVVVAMKKDGSVVFSQNYGLWYDFRRDDHERVRRRDGDVWGPFYEQPFSRTGQGTAWDGLSRYDLTKLNKWYYHRLRQFAEKGAGDGLLLLNQHYFQHNIIEAGAHWVDCPWRAVNNVNATTFPEPVPFTGDKRVFMTSLFYDETNPVLRPLHKQYIMQTLDQFKNNANVIHSIGEEFTGPFHFTKFWLETVKDWETSRGSNTLVSLSATKDVQDSVLMDQELASVVDIIDIEQWFYHSKGDFTPQGGVNLAPRQYLRKVRVGKVRFEDVYRAVAEYTTRYPDKAVVYYARSYPEVAWAAFMAGGSCAAIPVTNHDFLAAVVDMNPVIEGELTQPKDNYVLSGASGKVVYSTTSYTVSQEDIKRYRIYSIDEKTGEMTLMRNLDKSTDSISLSKGIYFLKQVR